MATDIVILAAGKGTRMKSSLPKVLHRLADRPLLQHVVDAAETVNDANILVVTGHGAEEVKSGICGDRLRYIEQTEQLGTAHAVLQAASLLDSEGVTLILYGDVPLISSKTIAGMLHKVSDRSMSLLTVQLTDPTGYGRIVRDDNGKVMAIVEQKDASREQLQISEVNTGVLALPSHCLQEWLPQIGNENAQGEYYLTDIISIARNAGFQVETLQPQSIEEVEGVNNRLQLNNLERYYQKQQAERLMAEGVTLADATRIDVRGNLQTGIDNFIDINAVFEGDVSLGSNIKIGPNCLIINSTVADGVEIKANSVIEECRIGKNAVIGPFARLRPGTELAEGVKVGNFVETKKVRVGKGSKISHLSYVGDAELGDNVNVGAGTITCNYDGVNKHQTTIGDNAFIGSNTSLVAPVVVGRNATVGAGSTINKDVPENKLGLTRAKQRNISDWTRPSKKN
ncbi:MAG: bifunctional UDP-N-acetylglucosamine diphosphorylase/glucosamine-1-phosphate N-acetyltransferase GlmU [Porticoccus sp.]|nr:bifunctional UDP-N-acetylglucosamine diphosphorylase/glucosamine-1-phosphate N-acetyltransferase GlmU [Porticoccus sp.]MBQ0807471.1 bifunctional UDP-N-acetylglucosamine diphosphorylase/glucosamine-1-phosphate N-acetyltransferase GlmU [Porticoccus sp.]